MPKLSLQQVQDIKLIICQGYSQAEAGRRVGVSAKTVSNICAEKVHKDIPWPCTDREARIARERKELFPDG